MFRQSPSRNQRSKGFRIKHGLQIFLLLAICLWLLYQVKHSHDKKKAFDENSFKLSHKTDDVHHIIKLGRKDLHPQLEEKSSDNEISSREEVIEGDEDDNKEDDEENKPEEEEEENKLIKGGKNKHDEEVEEEEEEEEEEENKPEESEEEGRGAGDDEIDEQDQEVAEEEAENGDNSIGEDDKDGKEGTEEGENADNSIDREEKDEKEGVNEVKVEETKDKGLSDDQDRDRNTQEAREVNYKGDDASSAVLRETQVVSIEAESGNLGDSTEKGQVKNTEKDTLDLDDKTNSTENSVSSHDIPEHKMVSGDMIEGNNSSNLKTTEEKGIESNTSTNSKTSEENRNNELQTNSTVTISDGSPVVNNTLDVHPSNSFVQNTTHITSGSTEDTIHERVTDNGGESKLLSTNQAGSSNVTTELEKSISDNRISTPIENADVTKGEFSDTSNNDVTVAMEEQTLKSSSTVDEEKNSLSSTTNANVKVGATDGTEEASSIVIENAADATQSLNNESNKLGISHEETDLGTLAESETEGMKGEDVAAE